jgi:hypothetical protein
MTREVSIEVTIVVHEVDCIDPMHACSITEDDLKSRFPENWGVTINDIFCTESS